MSEEVKPGIIELLPLFDADFRIVDFLCATASPAAPELLGGVSGELVGRHLGDLVQGPYRSDLLAACAQVALTGKRCRYVPAPAAGNDRVQIVHAISRPAPRVLKVQLTVSRPAPGDAE